MPHQVPGLNLITIKNLDPQQARAYKQLSEYRANRARSHNDNLLLPTLFA
jgi:hypothetical protein